MNIFLIILKILKFPLKILTRLLRKKRKRPKRTELEKQQLAHVRNFDPTRLKNRTWQKSLGKCKKKSKKLNKKHYEKQSRMIQ